ncbi:hypothetical protein R3Q17_05320 [Rhodococcus opacus]|nr:hypothetical protein [Rhodococcus opacus]
MNTYWPIVLTASSDVLKWLNVPRAACTAMNPTSRMPVTANTVAIARVHLLPRCGRVSNHAKVAP